MSKRQKSQRFVSRGGDKLDGALEDLGIDVAGKIVADLGANVGGFTDCLLQRGAKRVYAVETGYGVLEWKLRQDERVEVLERTNALHVTLPELVDLVVLDVGWTLLGYILPRAVSLIGQDGQVVGLLKPQYEAEADELDGGVVRPECLQQVVYRVVAGIQKGEIRVQLQVASRVKGSGGNQEVFLLVEKV